MASWGQVYEEITDAGKRIGLPFDFDSVRRGKMKAVESTTGRPLIVYAVDVARGTKTSSDPSQALLMFQDKDGFLEAMNGLVGDDVDVLVQSLGGSAEATESIVALLRGRFNSVRFIIPSIAKSAATMLAMSGNEILLGPAAELGPTDPQMFIGGGRYAPAQAILDQFQEAKDELNQNPQSMPAWLPILQAYGPSLLQECRNQLKLSEELVSTWLADYMFGGDSDAADHASRVAKKLNDHNHWHSHGRRIGLGWLVSPDVGVKARDTRQDGRLNEAIQQLHLAISITFASTSVFKIVENSAGGASIASAQQISIQLAPPPAQLPAPGQSPQGPPTRPSGPGTPGQKRTKRK